MNASTEKKYKPKPNEEIEAQMDFMKKLALNEVRFYAPFADESMPPYACEKHEYLIGDIMMIEWCPEDRHYIAYEINECENDLKEDAFIVPPDIMDVVEEVAIRRHLELTLKHRHSFTYSSGDEVDMHAYCTGFLIVSGNNEFGYYVSTLALFRDETRKLYPIYNHILVEVISLSDKKEVKIKKEGFTTQDRLSPLERIKWKAQKIKSNTI